MLGHHPLLEARLRRHGQRAFAKVLEAHRTQITETLGSGAVAADTRVLWQLVLSVEPDGQPQFEARLDAMFPQLWSPEPSAKVAFAVLYDANDHRKVVLDRSEEGYKAVEWLLGRQHTTEMVEKLRSRGQNVIADRYQAAHDAGLFRTDDLPEDPGQRDQELAARRAQIKQIMAGRGAEDALQA
jgi:hypothetical protein